MSQLWKSPLNSGLHPTLHTLNASIGFDFRLWKQDIAGSRAHVGMLAHVGLLSQDDAHRLHEGLDALEADIAAGRVSPDPNDEDVHAFVERELVARVGALGSNIHMARSRNEQVLLDVFLWLRDEATALKTSLDACLEGLARLERAAGNAYMPSYTHLRRAQPVSVARVWAAHSALWRASRERLARFIVDVSEECPMGAGAINGTTLATDPAWEAAALGFSRPPDNALAMISGRRPLLEFCGLVTHWLLDVSRLMEDLVNWSSAEFGFVSLSPTVTTGSSMMPQKRNPDVCELLRGHAALAMGHYVGLMGLMKGLPMGYMKDLQNDKVALFAVADLAKATAEALPPLLAGVEIDVAAMESAARDPFLLATDVMEWCVTKGMPLRAAHGAVAEVVHASMQTGRPFAACVESRWHDFPTALLDPARSCERREAPKTTRLHRDVAKPQDAY
jgi:argininosuccinate lyase